MQNIIIDQPYRFVPPHRGRILAKILGLWLPHQLQRQYGLTTAEYRGAEHLEQSLAAGYGILLASNHCRSCDAMVMGLLGRRVATPFYYMASWHLFMQSRFKTWLLRRFGGFSVYREGMDREALKAAINILVEAERPLVIFPEGIITQTNDRLWLGRELTQFVVNERQQLPGSLRLALFDGAQDVRDIAHGAEHIRVKCFLQVDGNPTLQ